jgi:hypothetical protein
MAVNILWNVNINLSYCVLFIVTICNVLSRIVGYFVGYCGKKTTSVYIPEFFRSSSFSWNEQQWIKLLNELEQIIKEKDKEINKKNEENEEENALNVRFGLTDVVFKLQHIGTQGKQRQSRQENPHSYTLKFVAKNKKDKQNQRKTGRSKKKTTTRLPGGKKHSANTKIDNQNEFLLEGTEIENALTCKCVKDTLFDVEDSEIKDIQGKIKKMAAEAISDTFYFDDAYGTKINHKIFGKKTKSTKAQRFCCKASTIETQERELDKKCHDAEREYEKFEKNLASAKGVLKDCVGVESVKEQEGCIKEQEINFATAKIKANEAEANRKNFNSNLKVEITVDQNILNKLIEELQRMKHPDGYVSGDGNQHNWHVGIWELRLVCYPRVQKYSNLQDQDHNHNHENHLIGTEIVYQHESQCIKVFEPGGHGIPVIVKESLATTEEK